MSKVQESGSGRKGRQWSAKFNRTVKFYDANFDLKETKIADEIKPFQNAAEAMQSGDFTADELVSILNDAKKQKRIDEMTKEAMGTDSVSEVALMKFIEPLRQIKRIASITGKTDAETKALQTAACIEKVKSDPDLLEALRAAAIEETEEETA
jgi:hypothetical protein